MDILLNYSIMSLAHSKTLNQNTFPELISEMPSQMS